MRRSTRLTNGFSKTIENHAYAVELHMMYNNFAQSFARRPRRPLELPIGFGKLADIVALWEAVESKAGTAANTTKK
jgi:hypothetical protein